MNRIVMPFLFAFLAMPAWAKKPASAAPCQIKFTVIQEDTLKNITQGLTKKQLEWFDNKTQKLYPDVCYVPPSPDVPLVFSIIVTPDVYHGTRVETNTETHDSPVSGTITNPDGSTSDIDGTVKTTTTSSTAVPYTVHYGIYTLTVETREGPDKWKARHRFQQRGLYNTLAGIPLGGKGHHPNRAVIEEAMKWIHEGGLRNPLDTVAPQ